MDSKVEENYKRLREELNERLNNDRRLTAIMDKISKGIATFKDSAEYSQIVADHMGDVISKNIGKITVPLGKEMVCKELLKENIERVDTVFGKVQVSVDEKMGIHLNPVTPPYPTERVNAIAHSLEDPNADDEKVARRGKSSGNVVAARHDENVKANAAWREKAGLDCYLVRDAGGGCCAWCAAIAGRYKYADAPDDVFRRHDHCTCTTTYECGRMRQDVWSKRTWQASEKELEQRKALSEASNPTVNTPEQAKELERQALEKNPVTKLSPEQAKAIDEQSKATVYTKEQAQELNERSKPTMHTPTEARELEQKVLDKSSINGIMNLEDTMVSHSVGSKRKSYDVMDLQTGEHFDLVDGTYIRNKQVFAGKGVKSEFRKAEEFANRYGGNAKDWQHVKGIGTVNYHGEGRDAELHWAQCENIGMKEIFVKEWLE